MAEKYFKDEKTGLFWELKSFGARRMEYDFAEALEYADELNAAKYGGFDDWRLPSLDELSTLCNITPYQYNGDYKAWRSWYESVKEAAVGGFFILEALADNVGKDGWYWSSTKKSDTEYYLLNFKEANTNFHSPTQSFYVRCVRF